jgi:hypothetical protein
MRIAWLCLLALGCAHRASDPAVAAQQPGTASALSGSAGDGAQVFDEISGCSTDADCATTRVKAGGCCPTLCAPRVVTRKRAEALEANVAICHEGKRCPEPLCRPPTTTLLPTCVQNRCVGRSGGPPD